MSPLRKGAKCTGVSTAHLKLPLLATSVSKEDAGNPASSACLSSPAVLEVCVSSSFLYTPSHPQHLGPNPGPCATTWLPTLPGPDGLICKAALGFSNREGLLSGLSSLTSPTRPHLNSAYPQPTLRGKPSCSPVITAAEGLPVSVYPIYTHFSAIAECGTPPWARGMPWTGNHVRLVSLCCSLVTYPDEGQYKEAMRGGGRIKSHEVYEETEGSDFNTEVKKGFPEEIRFDL